MACIVATAAGEAAFAAFLRWFGFVLDCVYLFWLISSRYVSGKVIRHRLAASSADDSAADMPTRSEGSLAGRGAELPERAPLLAGKSAVRAVFDPEKRKELFARDGSRLLRRNLSTALDSMTPLKKRLAFVLLRHQQTVVSVVAISIHVVCGLVIMLLGCACFVISRITAEAVAPPRWAALVGGAAALVHVGTVPFLLPKVDGLRRLTVPWYVSLACINAVRAASLLSRADFRSAMELWSSFNMFVYVRIFYVALFRMCPADDPGALYTFALLFAGILGTALGREGVALACGLIYLPPFLLSPVMDRYQA